MKSIIAAIKFVKVLTVVAACFWVANKAPQMVKTSTTYAQEIANTKSACASHTAACNEAIEWASK